jgi:hypothetical protein
MAKEGRLYNFSPPQRGERANDECSGIGYWKTGLKAVVFIEPIRRNPPRIKLRDHGTAEELVGPTTRTPGPDVHCRKIPVNGFIIPVNGFIGEVGTGIPPPGPFPVRPGEEAFFGHKSPKYL